MGAILNFSALSVAPATDTDITVTFGNGKTHMRWTDRRTMPFADFASMLSDSPVGTKDGACYTPAALTGVQRHLTQTERIDMAVLDSDCGHTLAELTAVARAQGWECIIHSTFSHMTDETAVSVSAYDKWRAEHGDDPGRYIREKKGYLPRISEGAFILDEREKTYVVKHQPCPKYRVIFRLERPWQASDFSAQEVANEQWRSRLHALSHVLRVHPDEQCKDTSRLFYMPRRPDASRAYEFEFINGSPCPIWDLPDAPGIVPDSAADLFTAAAPRPRPVAVSSGDKTWGGQINLTHWAATNADRFEVVNALKARQPGVFGHRKSGAKHHIQCPFDDEHTIPNDRTGTFVVNASEIKRSGLPMLNSGFYVACKHAACSGRDRLDFLAGMLDKGWLSVDDLNTPLAYSPEEMKVMVDRLRGASAAIPDVTPENDPGNIPPELLENLPGAMGEIYRYLVETNIKPQPVLALGASIAAMSAALGRKVMVDGWGTRPNIFIVGVANTGAGKDRQLSGVKDILRKAGLLKKFVGTEDISSDTGILAEAKEPGKESHVMLIDEIGKVIGAMGDRNAGPHMRNVVTIMLKLYSASNTTFKSKSYADHKSVFYVDQPSISLFGATTPAALYNALTTKDLNEGLMSRVLLFDAKTRYPRSRKPMRSDVPDLAVEWFKAWDAVPPNPNPVAMEGGEKVADPRPIGTSAGAERMLEAFEGEMHDSTLLAQQKDVDAVYVRAGQNAYKLALIHACSVMPDRVGVIEESSMKWAIDLSRALTNHMAEMVHSRIFDNDFQRSIAAFREAIKKAGPRGLTTKEMARKKVFQTKDSDKVMEAIMASEEVAFLDVNFGRKSAAGHPVKAREAWVWIGSQPDEES